MPSKNSYTSFSVDFDFNILNEFNTDLKNEVIENGLDASLLQTLEDLKQELLFVINEKIRLNKPKDPFEKDEEDKENGLGQPTVSIAKSDDELIKYLTNGQVDPSKYNKAKDYTTLNETNMVFGNTSQGQTMANRVALRMDISDHETVKTQFIKAKEFFQEAMFALPDNSGNINYYVNPGIDLSKYIKIKCSVFTGDGDKKAKKGFSPEERFEKNRQAERHADWTLKQDALNMIRRDFINISPVINSLKQNDTSSALGLLDRYDNKVLEPIKQQIHKLEKGQDVPESTQVYTDILKLIKNLKFYKKINENDIYYTLVSGFEDIAETATEFLPYITDAINKWQVLNEQFWINSIKQKLEEIIEKYES
jgi:hypothetical protein